MNFSILIMEKGQNLLKNSLERIEEMYRDNKNIHNLYQQTLQKYLLLETKHNKLIEKVKEKEETIKDINSFLDKYNFNSLNDLIDFVEQYFCFLEKYYL
jgi:Na+/phosphate symporter